LSIPDHRRPLPLDGIEAASAVDHPPLATIHQFLGASPPSSLHRATGAITGRHRPLCGPPRGLIVDETSPPSPNSPPPHRHAAWVSAGLHHLVRQEGLGPLVFPWPPTTTMCPSLPPNVVTSPAFAPSTSNNFPGEPPPHSRFPEAVSRLTGAHSIEHVAFQPPADRRRACHQAARAWAW
jgi:hypothetical protein